MALPGLVGMPRSEGEMRPVMEFFAEHLALGMAAWSKCSPWQTEKRAALAAAVPQLGSYASSVCAWWLWSARYSQARGRPTGRPATALGARASSLQVRPFPRL